MADSQPVVFLGMPNYDGNVNMFAAMSFATGASKGKCKVFRSQSKSSLLPDAFNSLWVDCLNQRGKHGFTHFAMLHSDIAPEDGWVDTLVSELERTGADLISAVSPIKDTRGVTSTAIDDQRDPWTVLRRLTLKEVYNLPETFGAAEAGWIGHRLLVNTGCWVCRLDRPWVEQCDTVFFEIKTRIIRENGGFTRQVIPEDWAFSRAVQDAGGRVLATRLVRLHHYGFHAYSNASPWGHWNEDEKRAELEPRLAKIRSNGKAVGGAGLGQKAEATKAHASVAIPV